MSGQYNKVVVVVVVSKFESLTTYEKSWDKYKENTEEMKKMQEKMTGYTEMYLTGSREIYQVGNYCMNIKYGSDKIYRCHIPLNYLL